jgi:hypothetical protein
MKRAFAVIIVLLLALGMIGLFFPALEQSFAPVTVPATTTTTP